MNRYKSTSTEKTVFLQSGFYTFMVLNLLLGNYCFGAITITGVAAKQVYADSVTFTITKDAGYDLTATVNGSPVAVGSPVTINQPDYYELSVTKRSQSTGTEESTLIQFVVRNSARANTEWGLPTHTPYPMIDSSTAEFAGGNLMIVTPASYPVGLEIPVVAWVKDSANKRMGVNGRVTAAGFENYPLTLFRGVGSVFLPAATTAETISYPAAIATLSNTKQINIESSTTWQSVSGTISSSVDWGANARVKVTGLLTVASGATLTIGAGSVIVVAADTEIAVNGTITTNGTVQEPVVFTAQNRTAPWGGFLFKATTSVANFNGTIFTASGADASWFGTNASSDFRHKQQQCLFYLSNGAHVTATDCYMIENAGQLGHGETSYLTLVRCLAQKMITAGQYNSGGLVVQDSAAIEVPYAGAPFEDDDNDAFYINGGPHSFTNSLIGWTLDDGVDAGEGTTGAVTFTNCWFESCIHEGLAISSGNPRNARVINTVVINCGQGLESGYGGAFIDADNCLSTANAIGARFGDNYGDRTYTGFLDVKNSLLLFNVRDVWGITFDNWQWHSSQMDIQGNCLSAPNEKYPNNTLWDPQSDPNQLNLLTPFMTTASPFVGVGLAVTNNELDISQIKTSNTLPVRLSTFTTNTVSVDYSIVTDSGTIGSGTLTFIPGQTVRKIEFTISSPATLKRLRVILSSPVGAQITRFAQVVYQKPYLIEQSLVAKGDTWDYFKGLSEPPADWNQIAFTLPTDWLTGPSGFGYEEKTGYGSCISTDLTDMYNNYLSVYARRMFWIDDPQQIQSLVLGMLWDDGYIAYINGQRVSSQYPPTIVAYNQPASTSDHEACCGCAPDQFDLSSYKNILVPGFNVLAVQAHNTSKTSSDFLFIPSLKCTIKPLPGDIEPDGDVDLLDFALFSEAWLSTEGQDNYIQACDIDSSKDGVIDILDLAIFIQSWLKGF